jgi:hypothetical protein
MTAVAALSALPALPAPPLTIVVTVDARKLDVGHEAILFRSMT